jgi:hypothetical protein
MFDNKTTPLAAVWSQVTALLESGYSLIPVRDKEESGKPAKSPYPFWKSYQSKIISQAELWEQMEKFKTSAIAIICGKVSGNLEVIDIDVKWKPGVDAKIFSDIKQLYPDLWRRLRVHRSPSGGFHILYKIIDQPPPGSQKISSRETTPQDNSKSKAVSFIETRGEGGYILAPPSLGYSIYKADPVPLLTWAERCSLISICQAYNEVIKIAPQPKGNKFENEYYDENPFDHFNNSESGSNVLIELGWKPNGYNSSFSWFIKPGSKSKERHASFIKDKRIFYFWTTNTEFDSNKNYTPSSVLALSKYNGDYKLLYKELVSRGFGKIRPSKEAKIIKLSKNLPANISKEGKEKHSELVRERSELHPHGVFWQVSPEADRVAIDREGLYKVADELGYRLYQGAILKLVGRFLRRVEEREVQDSLKAYIKEKDPDLRLLILNTYEYFLQVAGKFTLTRLRELRPEELLSDTYDSSYKFYQDCYIKITSLGYEVFTYDKLDKIVFEDSILKRDFKIKKGGVYLDFLNKAVEYEKRQDYIESIIGYLSHDYKNDAIGFIILLTEQCENPRQGGGSGKNLFCSLLKHNIKVSFKSGSQVKYDEKFLQTWNGERVFVISDVPKNFDFLFLRELATGYGVWKKLFKNEISVPPEDMPKFVLQTNYSYNDADPGVKRRVIPLEFTDFFTQAKGVDIYYNKHFTRDWNEDDWAGYDYVIITSIQRWLSTGLKITVTDLTEGGWRKQFSQKYPNLLEFIEKYYDTWLDMKEVNNMEFNRMQDEFCRENKIHDIHWPGSRKINEAISEYFTRRGWLYEVNVSRGLYKVRSFVREIAPF